MHLYTFIYTVTEYLPWFDSVEIENKIIVLNQVSLLLKLEF